MSPDGRGPLTAGQGSQPAQNPYAQPPPATAPGYQQPREAAPWGPVPSASAYQVQQPYGAPPAFGALPPYAAPQPYGPPPYGYQDYGPPNRATNGMAIASMVLGILWLWGVGSILALVFGYVGRSQIRQRNEGGNGMAIAGIVLGWLGVGLLIFWIVVFAAAANSDPSY
jgi:Domain of unknown function (DUF4190)